MDAMVSSCCAVITQTRLVRQVQALFLFWKDQCTSLLIALAIRLVPPDMSARCRREAWQHLRPGDRCRMQAGLLQPWRG